MKRGVKRLSRRGWRVVSQSGDFHIGSMFGLKHQVTVVFEKREDESR